MTKPLETSVEKVMKGMHGMGRKEDMENAGHSSTRSNQEGKFKPQPPRKHRSPRRQPKIFRSQLP